MKPFPAIIAAWLLLVGGTVAAVPQQPGPAGPDSLQLAGIYASSLGEFTLYLPEGYPPQAASYLYAVTSDVALALSTRFGPVPAAPFQLVVVKSREQLEAWVDSRLPKWIQAVAQEYPPRVVLLASAGAVADPTNRLLEQTLLHELTHVYLYHLYPSRAEGFIPAWFHEGLAVHLSTGLDRGLHRALIRGRLTRRFYTLQQLNRIYHTSAVLSELAYAQSVVAAQCLETFYGKDVFLFLFDGIRQGLAFAPAFALATGETLDQFQTRYQADLRRRYNLLVVLADSSVLFILLPLLVLVAYFTRIWRNRLITARWAAEGSDDTGSPVPGSPPAAEIEGTDTEA